MPAEYVIDMIPFKQTDQQISIHLLKHGKARRAFLLFSLQFLVPALLPLRLLVPENDTAYVVEG